MSRRPQPQRKRREKQFDPLKSSGYDNRRVERSLFWRFLHGENSWLKWAVTIGGGALALSAVFGSCLSSRTGNGNTTRSDARLFDTATPTGSVTPTGSATPAASVTATATPTVRRFAAAPELQIDPSKQYVATIKTDKGDITVQLDAAAAPAAVNSFVFLAKNNYYDGLTFNRVIPNFVAQAGDAGIDAPGYSVPVEQNPAQHDPGTIVLAANTARGGLSGQFYFPLQALPQQQGKDTVIGRVISGQDVLAKLTERNPERNPNAPPGDTIMSIQVTER